MRLFTASLCIVCCWLACSGQSAPSLLSGRSRVGNGVIGFYAEPDRTLCAILRFEKSFRDYERRGFFRIGVLPVQVFEGITLEVFQPQLLTNGLGQLHGWLTPETASRLELRRVVMIVDSGVTNRLEAACARAQSSGKLELGGGVYFHCGTNEVRAASAILQLTGVNSGQLVLETTPPWTNRFDVNAALMSANRKQIP